MSSNGTYRLGRCTVDLQKRVVCRDGHATELGWRAAEALRLLAEAKGALVPREAFFARLWPGVTVDESSLNKCISQVRKALSNGDGEELLETVPRMGYRLTVGVEAEPAKPEGGARRRFPWVWVTAMLLVGAVGVWAFLVWGKRQERRQAAEEAFRQGEAYLAKRDAESAAAAVRMYQKAVTLEPGRAEWYASLAQAIHRVGGNDRERAGLAIAAAERGVALAERCVGCQATLGFMLFYRGWEWERGERHLRRALELSPGNHEVNANLAMLLAATGRQKEALAAIDAAVAVNPFRASRHGIRASILYFMGRYEEAVAAAERAAALETCAAGADWRSKSLAMLGRRMEAVRAIADCHFPGAALPEGDAEGGLRRLLEASMGNAEELRKNRMRRSAWRSLLGDAEGAMDELEAAVAARHFAAIWMGVDPVYTGLRGNARYRELIDKIGFARGHTPGGG
ncbi:MAG: winged helix-turn-helix domain-containing protein [Bryobacteraceae bacterium]|nr:winged helix-turn-helix domain-containing protein [Bryobacteraceae bacterium]